MKKKKKEYRYYRERVWYWNSSFPYLHRTGYQTVYLDPVPCDMNPKSKYYSTINPNQVTLREVDEVAYKLFGGIFYI